MPIAADWHDGQIIRAFVRFRRAPGIPTHHAKGTSTVEDASGDAAMRTAVAATAIFLSARGSKYERHANLARTLTSLLSARAARRGLETTYVLM
jgi:hypothetical protein